MSIKKMLEDLKDRDVVEFKKTTKELLTNIFNDKCSKIDESIKDDV